VSRPRVAVVGHTEWITHARGQLPPRGEIGYLTDPLEEPGGGGAVSASQVVKLGAECLFYTALGNDDHGERTAEVLRGLGVKVMAARRDRPQTTGLSVTAPDDPDRTIIIIGGALFPTLDDRLPWGDLVTCDAVYFTGWDPRTLRAARAARRVVVTGRRLGVLVESGVRVDVLVASTADRAERVDPARLPVAPDAIVRTEAERGGSLSLRGREERYVAAPLPGPAVDSYGAGDAFVAAVTVGLARGLSLPEAVALGARCGAQALTGRGGLGPQLREAVTATTAPSS
jgi:ribokinase